MCSKEQTWPDKQRAYAELAALWDTKLSTAGSVLRRVSAAVPSRKERVSVDHLQVRDTYARTRAHTHPARRMPVSYFMMINKHSFFS